MKNLNPRGFTLIELLIVSALIGGMLALIVPVMRQGLIGSAKAEAQPAKIAWVGCTDGFLFSTDSQGLTHPITDATGIKIKC